MEKDRSKNTWVIIRVSSDEQGRKGTSVESQEAWYKKVKEEMHLNVVMFTKDFISGHIFPKKYFDPAMKVADEEGIDYIVVYDIDRYARNSIDGAWLIQKLHEKRNIKIVTSTKVYDWNDPGDKFLVELLLVLAERDQDDRLEKTVRGMVTKLKKGVWPLSPPFGCERVDYKLRLIPGYDGVIRFIFHAFIRVRSYAETARIVNNKYGREMGFELAGWKIKKIVQDKTYLGYLRWDGELFGVGDENRSRKELKAIDEETFERGAQVIIKISRRYSRASSSPAKKLVDEYGTEPTVEIFDLKPPCRKCGSYHTQKNGKGEGLNNRPQIKYICKDCGHQFRFPAKKQVKKIRELTSSRCRNCGSTSLIVEEDASGFWELICKKCAYIIPLHEYVDRHRVELRNNNEKKAESKRLKNKKKQEVGRNFVNLDSFGASSG